MLKILDLLWTFSQHSSMLSKKTMGSISKYTDSIFCELHSNPDKAELLHV